MRFKMELSSFPDLQDSEKREMDLEKALTCPRNIHSKLHSPRCWSADAVCTGHSPFVYEKDSFASASFASSTSTLASRKVPEQILALPGKKYGQMYRNLRWTLFSVYRRLNLLVIVANTSVLIIMAGTGILSRVDISGIATAVAANILLAVLMRQELVVNALFVLFGMCPRWMPLRIRRLAAKIYHLGGVHSGAAIAGAIWYTVLSSSIFRTFLVHPITGVVVAVMVITLILHILLIGIIIFSHPRLRAKYHNAWEAAHRYAGWTSVLLFWLHFGLLTHLSRNTNPNNTTILEDLAGSPVFWCLLLITVSLILPWLRLRKVDVFAEPLSNHAIRLHFSYTNLPLCAAPRLSDSPLREWHAFAGIPEESGVGFSVLVSKAGDWTTKMIQSPPTKLWVRGIPVRGVLHIAPIFNKIVLVATGSGIGPVLSLLYARNISCRIIWSTPDPLKTYQQCIIDKINLSDPNALIINTSKTGRPNLVHETYRLYTSSNAEAVFVISNPKVTRKVVYGLESRGVPIFAPIFDS